MKSFFYYLLFLFFSLKSFSQSYTLYGTVYDYFTKRPLDAVSVQSSSGLFAISDSLGKFSIHISKSDSIWFSYLNKKTQKYPVDTIRNLLNFEIALYIDAAWLPAVKVHNNNYHQDSVSNRNEYARIFNFKKPGIQFSSSPPSSYVPGGLTAGFDLDELINMFRFRRNKQILSMQERLIEEEQEKYINHRYTKYFVGKLTSLKGAALDSFIMISKPSYELLISMNDLELGYYVEKIFELYKSHKDPSSDLFGTKEDQK